MVGLSKGLNWKSFHYKIKSLNGFFAFSWWLQRELNQWHKDFQSSALPTELWSHGGSYGIWTRDLLRDRQTWWTTTLTNHWLRERDLNPRPSGYEPDELPDCYHPAIINWRRKRDSNPCADFSTCRFSRPIPSTGLGYSSICILQCILIIS